MYNHKLIFEDQVFQLDMDLPANTNATTSKAVRAAGQQGQLAVTILANDSAVALASGTTMTMSLLTRSTEAGAFTAPNPSQSMTLTAGSALTWSAGDKIMSMPVPGNSLDPDDDAWIKAKVATTDANAAGDIDVILEYLAV